MIKLFNNKKRWALLKPVDRYGADRRGVEFKVSRSRSDGTTIGLHYPGYAGGRWVTFRTEELIGAIAYVTMSEEELNGGNANTG